MPDQEKRATWPARPLPEAIGRYRVVERLGKGAMGIVYKAYDDVMARPVAVKVMMADLQDDAETSARFYREAHAAGQLVHRNIVTVFDMGSDDGRPYIVMELLEGRTLAEYLTRPEGVSIENKIALMQQVCDGLQLAHGKKIFHRDIKPGNLLVRDDGTLKIVDFGIARLASSSMTITGLIVGTPDYMSPEQSRGREIDGRSDIFSAGSVFYYMLTGRKPFAGGDLPAVMHSVQNGDPLPLRETESPPGLTAIVMKALAKSPADRYQTFGEMLADLTRLSRELSAENRRNGERVRANIKSIAALDADRRTFSAFLGAPVTAEGVEWFETEVHQHYPTLNEWLDSGADPVPRASVQKLLDQVTAINTVLSDEVELLRRSASELEHGRTSADAGSLQEALEHLTAALQAAPASSQARRERDRVAALLTIEQAARDRANALVTEASAASQRGEWARAIALAEEALAVDQRNAGARALRDRAVSVMESEVGRRQAQAAQLVDKADKQLKKGRFAEAEEMLAEARRLHPESSALAALAGRLLDARMEAEQASMRERAAMTAIAAARASFERGERAEALRDLRALLEREPSAPGVAAEITKLTAESERLRVLERRKAEAAGIATSAEAALQENDLDRALALARQALGLHAAEPLARKVQDMATARAREQALLKERIEGAAREMAKAKDLLTRGKFEAARKAVRAAVNLHAADAEAPALLARIDAQEAAANKAAQQEVETRQRRSATAPLLEQARAAETRRDILKARWFAENALALDLECLEAQQIVDRIGALIAAQPSLADETVNRPDGGVETAGNEDTVTLRRTTGWRRVLDSIKAWIPLAASGRAPAPRR